MLRSRFRTGKEPYQGIAAARKKGTRFGRPPKALDPQFESIVCQWQAKEISLAEALESLQASRSWFYKKIREKKSENIPL